VLSPSNVQYDFIWRHAGADTTLVTFSHHFDPPSGTFLATEYDADANGVAAPTAAPGDQLVWRWSVQSGPDAPAGMIIPNGDGTSSGGRFPSISLPP
jgi:hypothetical protein